jgi:hypothetical protein
MLELNLLQCGAGLWLGEKLAAERPWIDGIGLVVVR